MNRPDDQGWPGEPEDPARDLPLFDTYGEPQGWPIYLPDETTLPAQADPPQPHATPVSARRRVAGGVLVGVVAGALVLGFGIAAARSTATVAVSNLLPAAGAGWVYADPQLVTGIVSVNSGARGLATGIVVSEAGTVVTAYDAILGAGPLTVTLPDGNQATQVPAELAGFDVTKNLAVLRVPGLAPAAIAKFGTRPVGYGHPVTVVNQSGVEQPTQIATKIDGTNGSWQIGVEAAQGSYLAVVSDLLTITLDWTDKGGGGVVLDANGGVVGLVIQTADADGSARPKARLHAVPIDDVRAVVATVDTGKDADTVRVGPAGDLGIEYAVDYAAGQVIPIVAAVTSDGPAATAGIAKGDILMKIGDIPVRNNKGATIGAEGVIRMLEPGTDVTVEWESGIGGERKTATLTVGVADT